MSDPRTSCPTAPLRLVQVGAGDEAVREVLRSWGSASQGLGLRPAGA